MRSKTIALAFVAMAFMAVSIMPMGALSADEDPEMWAFVEDPVLVSPAPGDDGAEHSYLFDGILILIIVLVFASALHVRVRGMPQLKPPSKK